jgi:peroxiredoxin
VHQRRHQAVGLSLITIAGAPRRRAVTGPWARRAPAWVGLGGLVAAGLLAGVAGAGCAATTPAAETTAGGGGAPAPDFTLDGIDGARFRLADHRGKSVVLLDFWATWCDPCKIEMPHLVAMYDKYRARGLVIAAISIDGPETIAQVRGNVVQLGLPFPVLLDQESRVVAQYNPRRSAPYTVLISREGRVVRQHEGYTPGDETTLAAEIEAELVR